MNTIITVEDYKTFFPSSSLSDELIEMYCQMMTETIHQMAGISLEEGEVTETLVGNNNKTMYLKKRPVAELLEFESSRGTKLEDISINLYKSGITKNYGVFVQGQDVDDYSLAHDYSKSEVIKVKYKGGFIYGYGGNVPMTLKNALCNLINSSVEDKQSKKLKSYSRDDVSYTFRTQLEIEGEYYEAINRYISW